MRKIVSAAEYKEFGQGETYSGKFIRPVLREQDHETDTSKKRGDLMGFLFEDFKGEETIIGASHSIQKALTAEGEGVGNYYRITFVEKVQLEKGKSFNRYDVQAYDSKEEYLEAEGVSQETPEAKAEVVPTKEEPVKETKKGKK